MRNNQKSMLLASVMICFLSYSEISFCENNNYLHKEVDFKEDTNTAYGQGALASNHAINNTAFGFYAMLQNTTGESNTAFGTAALANNLTGNVNLAVGIAALYKNVTGNYNVAMGPDSLFQNISGSYNQAMGYDALHLNTSGDSNVSLGYLSLYSNSTGYENVAVGFGAGGFYKDMKGNVDGYQNIWIGHQAGPDQENLNNSVAIGYQSRNTKSNQVVLGNKDTQEVVLNGSVRGFKELIPANGKDVVKLIKELQDQIKANLLQIKNNQEEINRLKQVHLSKAEIKN